MPSLDLPHKIYPFAEAWYTVPASPFGVSGITWSTSNRIIVQHADGLTVTVQCADEADVDALIASIMEDQAELSV